VCGQVQQPLQAKPEQTEAARNADALFAAGRFAEATQAYQQALAQEPNSSELRNKLGDSLAIQKMFPEAQQAYEQALQLDPADADARQDLGLIMLTLNETEAAWEQFHYVLQSATSVELRLAAQICLGAVCARAGDLAGAAKYWAAVLREESGIAPVHYSLGTVYAHLGYDEGAIQEWQECLRLDPNHHEAGVALAELEAARARGQMSGPWAGRSGLTFLQSGLFGLGGILGALWDRRQ
jgi:tetratricopeptide (TPR) repeat protein